jgi:hypothetical protein
VAGLGFELGRGFRGGIETPLALVFFEGHERYCNDSVAQRRELFRRARRIRM